MTFAIAEKIQQSTFELDEFIANFKAGGKIVRKHINTLHACAIELAGRRAHELYDQEEGQTLSIDMQIECARLQLHLDIDWKASCALSDISIQSAAARKEISIATSSAIYAALQKRPRWIGQQAYQPRQDDRHA